MAHKSEKIALSFLVTIAVAGLWVLYKGFTPTGAAVTGKVVAGTVSSSILVFSGTLAVTTLMIVAILVGRKI